MTSNLDLNRLKFKDHLELPALLLLFVVVEVGFVSADASVSGSDDDDEGCGGVGEVDSAERRLHHRPFIRYPFVPEET